MFKMIYFFTLVELFIYSTFSQNLGADQPGDCEDKEVSTVDQFSSGKMDKMVKVIHLI